MGYVSTFNKFIKGEEKKKLEAGANPSIEEQADPAQTTDANSQDVGAPAAGQNQTATPTPQNTSVESNPAVISARQAVAQATENRDKVIAAKQAELDKLKADQNTLVNTKVSDLNKAIADAAKTPAQPTA